MWETPSNLLGCNVNERGGICFNNELNIKTVAEWKGFLSIE